VERREIEEQLEDPEHQVKMEQKDQKDHQEQEEIGVHRANQVHQVKMV